MGRDAARPREKASRKRTLSFMVFCLLLSSPRRRYSAFCSVVIWMSVSRAVPRSYMSSFQRLNHGSCYCLPLRDTRKRGSAACEIFVFHPAWTERLQRSSCHARYMDIWILADGRVAFCLQSRPDLCETNHILHVDGLTRMYRTEGEGIRG